MEQKSLLKQWRIQLLILAWIVSLFGIFFTGLALGIDFSGGTSFQVKLAQPVHDAAEKEQIRSIIEQRLNYTGLRDATVSFIGEEIVLADVAETDPQQVQQLESILLRQGNFEATLDGNVLFSGADFQVLKDPSRGYGLRSLSDGSSEWVLPFLLKPEAANRFTRMTFHQCGLAGVNPDGSRQYDCKHTYFFIDRPKESVLVLSQEQEALDRELLLQGNTLADIPLGTDLEELLQNAATPFVILDANADQNSAAWNQLSALVASRPNAIIPSDFPETLQEQLKQKGFELKIVSVPEGIPFVWTATGAKSVISLTEGVTNLNPYIADVSGAKVYSELVIQGSAISPQDAQQRLNSLTILLQSGSLPIAVESISKETISPLLGKRFLDFVLIMGVIALLVVTLIVYLRYRKIGLAIPLGFITLSELIITLGFASFVHWNLDMASIAGIIAAIGTGVNQQIIITDEVLQEGMKTETSSSEKRAKRAFFIIIASASTVLATMVPIILFGFGLGKLVGFAVTTTVGVLVGILITRPAYSEFAKTVFAKTLREAEQKE